MSSTQLAVRVLPEQLAGLDAAVKAGHYSSRAEAIRAGLDLIVKLEREREIAENYRQAYSAQPQDDWVGELGLKLAADQLKPNF